jgi:hypothetical protein
MQSFRRAAQEQGIPVLACRRSSSCLVQCLERNGLCGACAHLRIRREHSGLRAEGRLCAAQLTLILIPL